MVMKTDLVSLLILFLSSSFFFYRGVKQSKNFGSISIFSLLFFVSFLFISLGELFYIYDYLEYKVYEPLIKSLLCGSGFLLLTLVVTLIIDEYTLRKAKVLARLPFIGWLCGMYLSLDQIPYAFALVYASSLAILFGKRDRYRFVLRKVIIVQLFSLSAAFILMRYNLLNISLLNWTLIGLLFVSAPVVGMARVKQLVSKGDK